MSTRPLPSEMDSMSRVRQTLTYRIASGHYEPGSKLPSYRELGAEFGVSRTTVHKVFQQLQADGLISVVHARGSFVQRSLPVASSTEQLLAGLDQEMEEVARRSSLLGLSRESCLERLIQVIDRVYAPAVSTIAFVECNRYDTDVLTREIAEALEMPVTGLILQDVLADPAAYLDRFDSFITSLYHISELAEGLGSPERVIGVHHRASPASLLQVARLPRDCTVGVLTTNERTRRNVASTVQPYVATEVLSAALDNPAAVSEVLSKAQVIVDSLGSHSRVMRMGVEVPIITVQFGVDPESMEHLRQQFVTAQSKSR